MDNAVKYKQLTDEAYKKNFSLLTPVNHLNENSITEFMAVIEFPTAEKPKPTLPGFLAENIAHIDNQLKAAGAVLIRGASDCSDSFGEIPNTIREYRHNQAGNSAATTRKERIGIGESNSDFSIKKLILEDYFPRDPQQFDGFSVYTAGSVTPSTFIPLHNEGASYSTNLLSMPSILTFYCAKPPHKGEGCTLLAKNKDVIIDIPPPLRDKLRAIDPEELVSTVVFPSRENKVAVAIIDAILKITPLRESDRTIDPEQLRLNSIFAYWQDGLSAQAKNMTKSEVLAIAEKDISSSGGRVFFDAMDNLHVCFNLCERLIRKVEYQPGDGEIEVLYTDVPYHYSAVEVDIIRRLVTAELGSGFVEENRQQFDQLLELIVGKSYTLNLLVSLEEHLSGEELDQIRIAMIKNAVRFDYRQGDILIIDNHRVMHGREPHRCLDRQIKLALAM